MPTELAVSMTALAGGFLVMARVAGAVLMVPLPFIHSVWSPVRVILILALTVALFPVWPAVNFTETSPGAVAGWMFQEACLGLSIGLPIAFLTEIILFAMQIMGLQAGYSFASMVDPATQADSSILIVWGQLLAALLFFTMGFHREILLVFAQSLNVYPPGAFTVPAGFAGQITALGSGMLVTGLRLAMPSIGMLLLIDLSIALLGRINAQLQLLTLAFPVKMVGVVVLLSWTAVQIPRIYRGYAHSSFETLWKFFR